MTTDTQSAPTDAEIEALGHRMCWRYTPAANQFRGSTHTFNRTTLLNFARAVLARWGQPAHSGEPYGCVTTHRGTGQQFFYRYPAPPYLDNASECVTVYTAPQPVAREPLSPERVKAMVLENGYGDADTTDRERAAFIDGLRHGEDAHGIKGGQHGAE